MINSLYISKAKDKSTEEMSRLTAKNQTENYQSQNDDNHSRRKRTASNHEDITALLDDMLHEDKYDRRLRPNINGKQVCFCNFERKRFMQFRSCDVVTRFSTGDPVKVEVGIWVIALDSINVLDMVCI